MSKNSTLEMKIFALLLILLIAGWQPRLCLAGQASPEGVIRLGPRLYSLGTLQIDTHRSTLSFPATVNLADSMIEYALVSTQGKTHESLLKTEVAPRDIHVACLLLGVKPSPDRGKPGRTLRTEAGSELNIEIVRISLGGNQTNRLEDWVQLAGKDPHATNAPFRLGAWAYTGSIMHSGHFIAQEEGSIISLIRDPAELINNPGPDRDNDEIHRTASEKLPPVGTPVTVRFIFKSRRSDAHTTP